MAGSSSVSAPGRRPSSRCFSRGAPPGIRTSSARRATIETAAALNLALGVAALVYGRGRSAPRVAIDPATARGAAAGVGEASSSDERPLGVRLTVVALGISGAVSMLYEVTWTRALA